MQYSDVEMKLIRLALDKAAHDGEFANAATMLIKQLRKRGVTPEQLAGGSNSSSGNYEALYRQAESNASYYRSKAVNLENEVTRLNRILQAQTRQAYSSGTAGESTQSKPRRPRTKYGSKVLSDKEKTLLFKIARRAGEDNLSRPIRAACDTHAEFGTIQQLMRKGMVMKLSRRGWHSLTEQGIEYWRKYGTSSI